MFKCQTMQIKNTIHLQLQNTLLKGLCLDMGATLGNTPILYECHFQKKQVRRSKDSY